MVRGCRYVIAIRDMERSSRFYRDVLGFEVPEIGDPGWRFFVKDACVIMAGECRNAPVAEETGDPSNFAYWQVDGIDRWYEDLCAKQVSIVKPLRTEPWGMREFGIRTVDDHRIMFGAAVQTPGARTLRPARVTDLEDFAEPDEPPSLRRARRLLASAPSLDVSLRRYRVAVLDAIRPRPAPVPDDSPF